MQTSSDTCLRTACGGPILPYKAQQLQASLGGRTNTLCNPWKCVPSGWLLGFNCPCIHLMSCFIFDAQAIQNDCEGMQKLTRIHSGMLFALLKTVFSAGCGINFFNQLPPSSNTDVICITLSAPAAIQGHHADAGMFSSSAAMSAAADDRPPHPEIPGSDLKPTPPSDKASSNPAGWDKPQFPGSMQGHSQDSNASPSHIKSGIRPLYPPHICMHTRPAGHM